MHTVPDTRALTALLAWLALIAFITAMDGLGQTAGAALYLSGVVL